MVRHSWTVLQRLCWHGPACASAIHRVWEGELRRRLAGLLLGEELARKVYGELEAETIYN